MKAGDRVRFTAEWLRNTGHLTGPVPFMRGEIRKLETIVPGMTLATVKWDPDDSGLPPVYRVNLANLEQCR